MSDTPNLDFVMHRSLEWQHGNAARAELEALKANVARVEKLHAALTRLVEPRQGTYIVSKDRFVQCPFCTHRCDVEVGVEPVIKHDTDCPVVEALNVLGLTVDPRKANPYQNWDPPDLVSSSVETVP